MDGFEAIVASCPVNGAAWRLASGIERRLLSTIGEYSSFLPRLPRLLLDQHMAVSALS